MDSDLAALAGFTEAAKSELARLAKPIAGPITTSTTAAKSEVGKNEPGKVSLKSFFSEPLDSEEAVNQAVMRLQEHLLDLVRRKVKLIVE